MTNTQLFLAISVPILFNATMIGLLVLYITSRFDTVTARIEALNTRFDDMRDLWRAELRRVEEILDARLKTLEEHRRP